MESWKRTLYIMFYAQMVTAIGFSSIFPFLPLYVAHLGTRTQMSVELLAGLVSDLVGYRTAFIVTAFLLSTAGVLILLGVKKNFNPLRPADRGRAGFLDAWQKVLAGSDVRITYGIRFVSQLGRMMLVPVLPLFIQLLAADTARLNILTGCVVGPARQR